MSSGKHLDQGEFAKGTAGYTGYHRDAEPMSYAKDTFGLAIGNRSTKPCYGESTVEERGSNPHER